MHLTHILAELYEALDVIRESTPASEDGVDRIVSFLILLRRDFKWKDLTRRDKSMVAELVGWLTLKGVRVNLGANNEEVWFTK